MPPKPRYSRDQIVDVAFGIAREEGISGITIRKIAQRLGSSVAPVYVNFADADELRLEVVRRVARLSSEMLAQERSGSPLRDLGAASVRFASEYGALVRDLLLGDERYLRIYAEEADPGIVAHMSGDPQLEGCSEEEIRSLLLKLRVFHTGISVMVANRLMPDAFGEQELVGLMDEAAADLIAAARGSGTHGRHGVSQRSAGGSGAARDRSSDGQ